MCWFACIYFRIMIKRNASKYHILKKWLESSYNFKAFSDIMQILQFFHDIERELN